MNIDTRMSDRMLNVLPCWITQVIVDRECWPLFTIWTYYPWEYPNA